MEKKFELKDFLLSMSAAVFVVLMLLLPMLNLLYFPSDEATGVAKMNGFDLMNSAEYYEKAGMEGAETWAVFQWIFFIVSIFTVLIYLVSDKKGGVLKFLIAFCIIYCTFYLVQGLVLLSKMNESIKDVLDAANVDKDDWDEYLYKTAAFWPVIVSVVCGVAYYLVNAYKISDKGMTYFDKTSDRETTYFERKYNYQPQQTVMPQTAISRNEPSFSEEKKLEMLVKWKELLDSGVISQEDFDKKKKEFI